MNLFNSFDSTVSRYVLKFYLIWTLLVNDTIWYLVDFNFLSQHLFLFYVITRRNATIPWELKRAIQSPFNHHSVDWMAGTFQWPFSDHSVPFSHHSVAFQYICNIHFSSFFFVYTLSYMHYFFIFLMQDPPG